MSFVFSNSLVKSFREGAKAEATKRAIASTVVRGRSEGCTVRYTGCGRVQGITFDPSNDAGIRDEETGHLCPTLVAQAVKRATLDAQQQIASVKQAEWSKVNPRILTERMEKKRKDKGRGLPQTVATQNPRQLLQFIKKERRRNIRLCV